jgi:hypothetical protein
VATAPAPQAVPAPDRVAAAQRGKAAITAVYAKLETEIARDAETYQKRCRRFARTA